MEKKNFVKYRGFVLVILIFLIGCGGGSKSGGGGGCCGVPGINVVVVSPTGAAAIDGNLGQTLAITVKVTSDSANAGVTWTVEPGIKGGPTGTLSAQQPLSVTFTPPTGVTSPIQVTVIATSVTDTTRSASIPIAIYPPLTAYTNSNYLGLTTAFLNSNYICIGGGDIQTACEVAVLGGPIDPGTGNSLPVAWSLGDTLLPPGLELAPAQTILQPPPPPAPQNSSAIAIIGTPTMSGIFTFSLTATDATGNSITQSFTINVAPAQLKVVTPTVMEFVPDAPPIAPYAPYAPIQLQASGGAPPYTWSVAPGFTLPSGIHLSSSGVISVDKSYTPPSNFGFAVQVVDSQTPVPAQGIFPSPGTNGTFPALINIRISDADTPPAGANNYPCASDTADNALTPPGSIYAFVLSGFDSNGPVTLSGSFTVVDNSGNLAGVEDIIHSSGPALLAQPLTGSSISADLLSNHGCLTLATSSSIAQFRFVPTAQDPSAVYTEGRIMEFDDPTGTGTRTSGYFRMQSKPAFSPPAGTFAFRFSGWDASTKHFAMAGTTTTQAGLLSSISADVNDGGLFSGALTGGSGTIGVPDAATGRGTATLSVGTTTYDWIYYIVDANHLIFNSANGQPLITGEATSTSAGTFSLATLSNSHIFRFGGDVPGSPDVAVGVLHFDGLGSVSGTDYERSGGTANVTTVSAQYVVDPTTGRFTFAGTGIPVVGYALGSSASGITGYLVGTGASAASGTVEFQTSSYPPGYQFGPILGQYGLGTDEMLDSQSTVTIGNEFPARNGQLDASAPQVNYLYSSNLTGLIPFQEFDLLHYTWSADGSGTYGGNTYMVTNGSAKGARFFYIDTSPLNAHPAVVVGQCWTNCQPN
jgi:Putative Ig domain